MITEFNTPIGNCSFNESLVERISAFIPKTIDVRLLNKSYSELNLETLDKDSVFYFDPPYFITSATYNDAKRACDTYRKYCIEHGLDDPGERFFFFHPAFPEDSVRLNLLANSARDTDITTRITNLIPSQSGLDPFTAFGWLSINAIVQALLYIGETPTISSIKVHLQDSMENLCSKALDSFCRSADQHEKDEKGELSHPSYDDLFNQEVRKMKVPPSASVQTDIKCQIYSTQYMTAPGAGNISSLVKLRNHPREHFSKMINNMLPLLDMLTVGTLGTMLSMSPGVPEH